MKKIAIFGASGYLGKSIVKTMVKRGIPVVAYVRTKENFEQQFENVETRLLYLDRHEHESLKLNDCCAVISTIGITKQREGFSYAEVDYQINARILKEAEEAGVLKFMYVSVFKGETFKNVAMCKAKEHFVAKLTRSAIPSLVVRPTGFYSDMLDVLQMAEKGTVHLFGSGKQKLNPISGDDLASEMIKLLKSDSLFESNESINIGGPTTLSHYEIAKLAFLALEKPDSIKTHPDWLRKFILLLGRFFIPKNTFGPYEFFLTAMGEDMCTREYGIESLYLFFKVNARKLN